MNVATLQPPAGAGNVVTVFVPGLAASPADPGALTTTIPEPPLPAAAIIPIKKITFDWCVEISQAEMIMFGEAKILEMFGDKLKQDFIKIIKNQ